MSCPTIYSIIKQGATPHVESISEIMRETISSGREGDAMKRFTIGKLMLWIVIVALATALVVQARQAVIRQNRLRARMEVLTSRYVKEITATPEVLDKAILEKTK